MCIWVDVRKSALAPWVIPEPSILLEDGRPGYEIGRRFTAVATEFCFFISFQLSAIVKFVCRLTRHRSVLLQFCKKNLIPKYETAFAQKILRKFQSICVLVSKRIGKLNSHKSHRTLCVSAEMLVTPSTEKSNGANGKLKFKINKDIEY